AALSISSVAIAGTNSGDFAQTNNCGSSVAAAGSCTINVTFKPTATGTRTATVSVTDNATGSPQTASLTGSGVASSTPAARQSPPLLTFHIHTVGTTSTALAVKLSNTGSAALSITNVAIAGTNSGDFAQTNNGGSSVAAAASPTRRSSDQPTATGTRTATVSVTDNATGSPQTASLTGSGVSSSTSTVTISPNPLVFPNQTVGTSSAVETATLKNAGTSPLTLTAAFTISGDFTFDPNSGNCPNVGSSLAAGGSCSITVIFTPTATGTRNGAVTIFDNAPNNPQTLPLTGTGS